MGRFVRSLPAVLLAAACAKSEPPAPPPAPPGPPAVVSVVAADYAFTMPDTLTAGPTTFHLTGTGKEMHHIQIVRLDSGKTVADLKELKPGSPPPAWLHDIGGPNTPGPAGESWGTVDLAPGNYVALCFIPSPAPDNTPHFMKGMVHPFVVVPATDRREMPAAHFTVTLNDYSFTWSGTPPAGEHEIRVVNAGPQAHEVFFFRLAPGKKAADLLAWFGAGMMGPPPGEALGGTTAIAPNGENVVKLNLTPGEYGLYCFVEDAKDSKMHIEHGMVSQVTVQ